MSESIADSKATGGSPSPGVRSPRLAGNSGKNSNDKIIVVSSARVGAAAPISENSSASNAGESQLAVVPSSLHVAGTSSANPPPGSVAVNAVQGGSGSPRSPKHHRRVRIKLTEQQLESATREELAAKWREQDFYVECLEAQAAAQEGELACLRDSEEKYRQQCCEVSHRERILVRRLASKEQQLLGYVNQITELRAAGTPSATALRSALLDPAVNILIQKLRQELQSTKAKLEDTQNELSAWKFTPDSNTGKRLMAKCRLLYQENEELGRMIASGRIAKLEGELALQKSFSEEVKKSQSELDEFLQDLDEDVEGMQSTIYFLQQELRKARESVSLLQQENNAFKSSSSPSSSSLRGPASSQPVEVALSNGLSTLCPMSIKKEDIVDEADHRVLDETKFVPSKGQLDDDSGGTLAQGRPSLTSGQPARNFTETKSELPERPTCRNDDNDESSNDSAALIIKVENEELSDRDDDDEDDDDDEVGKLPIVSCENRGPQRQSTRTKEKIGQTTINDSVIVGKSNGDEKSSSRSASRRLVRDRTAKREKSAADSDDDRRQHKKKRRESILSIDYNDDDALLLTNGEGIQSDNEDGP